MLKKPELTMTRSRQVNNVCNGKHKDWKEYEKAKGFKIEIKESNEGEEHDRAECVYIQLLHGLNECSDEDE